MMRRLNHLLEASAGRRPEHIAVVDPERDVSLSYRELNARADALGEVLRRHGVAPGDRVGLRAAKSVGSVASIFGALKAGAAYVPSDAGGPPSRSASVFEDCGVRAVITERSRVEELLAAWEAGSRARVESLEAVAPPGSDLVLVTGSREADREPKTSSDVPEAEPGSLAYVLYTSGSTGRPKGVVHTHDSSLSFVDWCSDTFRPSEEDRFSSHAPFHFDLSVLDLYVPFLHGATVVLIGEDLGKQPSSLPAVIAGQRISVWYSTPGILRLMAEYGRMDRHDYAALRMVLFAGEVFPVKHLRALKRFWPRPRYFNLFGPTETNVCTYYELPAEIPEDRTEPFPIGVTCSNDRTRVVDEEGRDVAPGREGELLVSGGSVMRGYWNLPERTEQAFAADGTGTRWYKTGDIVRLEDDGQFAFLGRRDRMVKRRGYRVELGEIEASLYRHPNIVEAAVVALPDEEAGVRILAFLAWSGGARPSLVELKQFCARELPLYMVPDRFLLQPSLPKTSTDKIDYQRLKEMG